MNSRFITLPYPAAFVNNTYDISSNSSTNTEDEDEITILPSGTFPRKIQKVFVESVREIPMFFGGQGYIIEYKQLAVEETNIFNKFLAKAVEYIKENAPAALKRQALPYLQEINERTNKFASRDFPRFTVSFPDENEMLIEWNFEHYKFGLAFDEEANESSWYVVNDGTIQTSTGWGLLKNKNPSQLSSFISSEVVT